MPTLNIPRRSNLRKTILAPVVYPKRVMPKKGMIQSIYSTSMTSCTHRPIGHEVVPSQFAPAVLGLVKLLHEGDKVFKADGQRDGDPL